VVKYTVYVCGYFDDPHAYQFGFGVGHEFSLSVAPSEDSGGSTSRRLISISQIGIFVKIGPVRKGDFRVEYRYLVIGAHH
jgi:hypothetical protein